MSGDELHFDIELNKCSHRIRYILVTTDVDFFFLNVRMKIKFVIIIFKKFNYRNKSIKMSSGSSKNVITKTDPDSIGDISNMNEMMKVIDNLNREVLKLRREVNKSKEQSVTSSSSDELRSALTEMANVLRQSKSTNSNVQLQPLWVDDPDGWFLSCEAAFGAQSITDEKQKYFNIIRALNKDQLASVQYVHAMPYVPGHLQALKSALISAYKPTEGERMNKILAKTSLDFGQRPSAAYRQMVNWAEGILDKRVVMSLWSKLLPDNIAPTIFQNINYEDLTDERIRRIVESADELMTRHNDKKQVNSMNRPRKSSSSRSSDSNKSRYRRPKYNPGGRYCYSHFRYYDKADRCDDPQRCKFRKFKRTSAIAQQSSSTQVPSSSNDLN